MAEKRYNGAPFGTQTARFDVTGVHPKNKVPGSFTQMPYDKYSMVEQKYGCRSSHSTGNLDAKKIVKRDGHLQNIRFALESTKEMLKEIESIKKYKSSPNTFETSNNLQRGKPLISSKEMIKTNVHKEQYESKKSVLKQQDKKQLNKLSLHHEDTEQNHFYKGYIKFVTGKENCHNQVTSQKAVVRLVSFNTSGNSTSDENPVKISQENLKNETQVDKQDRTSDSQIENTTPVLKSTCDSTPQDGLNVASIGIDTKDGSADILPLRSLEKIAKHTIESTETKVNTNEVVEAIKKSSDQASAGYDSRLSFTEDSKSERCLPTVLKKDYKYKSEECVVPSNSIASSVALKVFQKREKCIPCDEFLKRKLGPGTYNTVVGGFSPSNVEQRTSGPGWARQLEVERLAALPHLLYKEQWEENKMLKRKLGPGSYEIKDFIQANNLKPRSSKGICENLAQRFDKGVSSFTPGPGTYGMGGVPQRSMEEKCQQSTSTKGILDSGDRKRTLPSVGSHLGPGTYRHKTCTEEMLRKVTSLRGPYELYSGDRNKPISEGYLAAPKLADLGPGQYEIKSFVENLNGVHKKTHGAFGKMAQYPEVPTERLFLFSQAHCPKKKDVPGPGSYSLQEVSKLQAVNSPGFLSSAKRDDKLSQKFFTRNFNPVGAGRYDIQKFDEAQDVNGHSSVFRSKAGKPGLQMAKFLQERIRSKDVPVQDRMFITEPGKPALSRAMTVM